ncbi:unnamed protein product [Sympodiomycopsis kandeliae]
MLLVLSLIRNTYTGKMTKTHVQPRHVAVAIAHRLTANKEVEICLVSSRKHDDHWVLPKGGIEDGENEAQAAVRELWEEAGLKKSKDTPQTLTHKELVADHKAHKKSPSQDPSSPGFVPRAIYTGVEIQWTSQPADDNDERDDWPEKDERQREWLSLPEAKRRISWRKDIATILEQCSFTLH